MCIRDRFNPMKNNITLLTKFGFAFVIMVLISGFVFNFESLTSHKTYEEGSKYKVYALELPDDLSFAGEKVMLQSPDLRERLDRELLVNTYWQSNMMLLIKRANKYFPTIEKILAKKEKMISTILIGNNLVNIVASVYATSFAISYFGEFDLIFVTILLTIVLVIFAEVIPKTYAFSHADRLALTVAPIIRLFIFLFTPATFITERFAKIISGPIIEDEEAKTEELRGMIRLHAGNESRGKERGKMMSSMLDMDEVTIEAVMTHRGAVTMIDSEENPEIIFKVVGESPFTRIPIYSGNPDNIIGILHAKELFRNLRRRNFKNINSINLSELMIQPYFAPETTLLFDQLEIFKTRREHFAVVVDEYGDFRGIVTLEDILEEIVGEIDDETDIKVKGVKPQPDGSFIVDGSVTIRDLNLSLIHISEPTRPY